MYLNNKGQTLLEVTIGIGIAVVIVTALTIVTIVGLKNSQFSQNQTRATKLSQDWLDQVRSLRDQDASCVSSPNSGFWSNLFTTACSNACTYTISSGCLSSSSAADTSTPPFSRFISITDYQGNKNQKQITVTTSWTDSAGSHQSNLVEILGQP